MPYTDEQRRIAHADDAEFEALRLADLAAGNAEAADVATWLVSKGFVGRPYVDREPIRFEAILAAGEAYGAILADPERRTELRRARIARGAIEHEDGSWTWPDRPETTS